MKRITIIFVILLTLVIPVSAVEFTAPDAPESAEKYMPKESRSFGEDLWFIIKQASKEIFPSVKEAAGISTSLIAIILISTILQNFSGLSSKTAELVSTIGIATILLQASHSMIRLGIDTVTLISEYGKLLLPVMTTALAVEGGVTASSALYSGTVIFNTVLTIGIQQILTPLIYIYIALSIAASSLNEGILSKLQGISKWLITWSLKIALYIFTGYLSITGVVSGTVDAAAVKATKIAITGAVPVVGNIFSDASEAILVSAKVTKSTAGIYGLLTIIALCIGPFLSIAVQYIILKFTAGVCNVFGSKGPVTLIQDFSNVMGFLLASTGTISLLFMISLVCFMRGIT